MAGSVLVPSLNPTPRWVSALLFTERGANLFWVVLSDELEQQSHDVPVAAFRQAWGEEIAGTVVFHFDLGKKRLAFGVPAEFQTGV